MKRKKNSIKNKKDKSQLEKKDLADKYFHCSDRERAAFEAGIKLGSIFHQFVGAPISLSNVEALEGAIEKGVLVQPFVEDIEVKINKKKLKEKEHQYDYLSMTGDMLNVSLKVKYNNITVSSNIQFIKELKYPLMLINSIK